MLKEQVAAANPNDGGHPPVQHPSRYCGEAGFSSDGQTATSIFQKDPVPTAANGVCGTGKRQGDNDSEVGFVSAPLPSPCPAADSREGWGEGVKTAMFLVQDPGSNEIV